MVLNSLAIDPRRPWKGPWRWFHEEMLDCCHPLSRVRREGVTLPQAACLARCNGAAVEVYPAGCVSLGTFRDMVRDACSSDTERIIVAYSRKDFLQTGDGHHSPIGAYSEKEDLVLILDTARFKYPPHWIPLPLLYKSMERIDQATGQPRGFMRLGSRPRMDSVLFTLDVRDQGCAASAGQWIESDAPHLIAALGASRKMSTKDGHPNDDVSEGEGEKILAKFLLRRLIRSAPLTALSHFIAVRSSGNSCHAGSVCTQRSAVELLLGELTQAPLYEVVASVLADEGLDRSEERGRCSGGTGSAEPQPLALGHRRPGTACCEAHAPETGCSPMFKSHAVSQIPCNGLAHLDRIEPAAEGPLLAERLTLALLMLPRENWRAIEDVGVRNAVLDLLDISTRKSK